MMNKNVPLPGANNPGFSIVIPEASFRAMLGTVAALTALTLGAFVVGGRVSRHEARHPATSRVAVNAASAAMSVPTPLVVTAVARGGGLSVPSKAH